MSWGQTVAVTIYGALCLVIGYSSGFFHGGGTGTPQPPCIAFESGAKIIEVETAKYFVDEDQQTCWVIDDESEFEALLPLNQCLGLISAVNGVEVIK